MSDYEAWAAAWAKSPSHVAAANEVDRLRAFLAEAERERDEMHRDYLRIAKGHDDMHNQRDEARARVAELEQDIHRERTMYESAEHAGEKGWECTEQAERQCEWAVKRYEQAEARAERAEEDCERIQMWLDDKGIPRANERGEVYSIVGRIMHLLERAEADLATKMAELNKNKELDERLLQVALECRVEANVRAERAEAELAVARKVLK